MTTGSNISKQGNIDRYKNFGLKEEWVEAYFVDRDDFWTSNHGLNENYQILLLALLSCPLVKSQIFAKRFTQDIIDTLGERIHELLLPIPKDEHERKRIIDKVKTIINYKKKAKDMTRKVVSSVVPSEGDDSKFMTLIVD